MELLSLSVGCVVLSLRDRVQVSVLVRVLYLLRLWPSSDPDKCYINYLHPDVTWTILLLSLLHFCGLIVVIFLQSMRGSEV